MKKFLIGLVILVAVLFLAFQGLKMYTKSHSPEETVELSQGDTKVSVFYCRPSKKGRVIFGDLLPYGEVWRTGANEATTLETNKDIQFGGETLKAGKYTLWTIPGEEEWTVIINEKQYGWGVGFDTKASREADADVLQVKVPVEKTEQTTEMFTIEFNEGSETSMDLIWDQTKVSVPIGL